MNKIRSRVNALKRKPIVASPGSGNWQVELLDNSLDGSVLTSSHDKGGLQKMSKVTKDKLPFDYSSDMEFVTDAYDSVLQSNMASLAEKKKALRESISHLKQVLQQEEDEELRQLMRKEEELCNKLARGETSAATSGQSNSKTGEVKGGDNKINMQDKGINDMAASLQNITGVQFDMSGLLSNNVGANAHGIDSVMSLSERKSEKAGS